MFKKIIFLFFFMPFLAVAQNNEPALKLDLPLFDLPYQIDAMNTVGHGFFSSYANPSMAQSLAVTTDILSSFHFGMKILFDSWDLNVRIGRVDLKTMLFYTGLVFGDFLLFYVPGGEGWVHEEFHRAVMTRHRVGSFNDMNTFPFGRELISVNSITDEDLIRFKAESPADFVRMHAAGMEGDLVLLDHLRHNSFFYKQQLEFYFLDLMVTLNSHMSLGSLNLYLSLRVLIGMQPENQGFKTGNEFLEKNVSIKLGLSARL